MGDVNLGYGTSFSITRQVENAGLKFSKLNDCWILLPLLYVYSGVPDPYVTV